MSSSIAEALLNQKIEFLQIELEEFKKKEENYRKTNECLLQALGNTDQSSVNSQSYQELKKTAEQLEKENFELKSRYKEKITSLEKEKQDLALEVKNLEFGLKQQRLALESEKLEIISQLQKLESDKFSVENALKSYENDRSHQNEIQRYQSDLKVVELERQLELEKEISRNELLKARQESDKAIIELKAIFEREIDTLKNQSYVHMEKIRNQSLKIESLKEDSNPQLLMIRIEELESELEYYKNVKGQNEKKKDQELEFISSREDISEIKNLTGKMKKNKNSLKEDYEIDNLSLQNERLKLQLDRARLEIDQLNNEFEKCKREYVENEGNLKHEVKFLIGKLLKAKSKLSIEGELSETVRKESMLSTLRCRSVNKSKYNSRASPTRENEQQYY